MKAQTETTEKTTTKRSVLDSFSLFYEELPIDAVPEYESPRLTRRSKAA